MENPIVFLLFRGNVSTLTHVESSAELPQQQLHVYPNPTADHVRFTLDGHVQIFDVLGRKVLDEQVNSQRQMAVDHLPDGLYLYRLITHTESYSGKLIKQ